VASQVAAEEHVVVSTLAHFELRCRSKVGSPVARSRPSPRPALLSVVDRTLAEYPYEIAETPSNVYSVAAANSCPWAAPCIAGPWIAAPGAMEALGLRRLLTNDEIQGRAAKARGFEVLLPR